MKKIILVDGNNLLFRSFFATSYNGVIMRNSKGFPTNALYGFINMMNKIITEEKPNYILVAFDKGKTFRHDQYESYKAGRKEMPEDLKVQFPKAKEVLDAMGIQHFEIDNYEADDIIGTLSKQVDETPEFIATIISSDKDLLQLISHDVDVKLLKTKGFLRFDEAVFLDTYGVSPIHMIDLKALMGDASDRIPGVKGIGEKTAISLLSQYKTLDNLYENLEKLTPKTREKLIEDRTNAYMSYDLATIYREVPLPFSLEDCQYNQFNKEAYLQILRELEFKSLLKKLAFPEEAPTEKQEYAKEKEISIVDITMFDATKPYAIYLEMNGYYYNTCEIIGAAFSNDSGSVFLTLEEIKEHIDLLTNNTLKYTYDVKKCFILLHRLGIRLNCCQYDAMIAAYLLDYSLNDDITTLMRQFDWDIATYEETYGTEKRRREVPLTTTKEQTCRKSKFIYQTHQLFLDLIAKYDETPLFEEIEMPLAYVLADMELTGIKVNRNYLEGLKEDLHNKMVTMEQQIYKDAGCQFNIMSPKQLGDMLFDKLSLPYPKKRKKGETGYSTSKDILDRIIAFHPIVEKILEYRTLAKLYTNYAVGLLEEIGEDGRIHTMFNQCLTRTGRLSSNKPNLQNIPIRTDYSRLIRKAFIPDEESVLLSSDYSQIELRVFAHMSQSQHLIEAFQKNADIHTQTAADIFHVPSEQVDKTMRRTAKAVNFGILYGISSFGLSEDLQIDVGSAKAFIDNYLETYPGIKEYMAQEKSEAYQNGYVTTIMNRRRVISELKSKNYMVRSQGERMALNTPIQGSAADILKKAMVEVYREFEKQHLKSKILIQVHDELVFNVYEEELAIVQQIVKDKMETVVLLDVPLNVDIEIGHDWYEAK